MWTTLGIQGSKVGLPIELLKNNKTKFRKHVFIAVLIFRHKIEKVTLKIIKC